MNPVIKSFLIWKNRLFFKKESLSFAATLGQARFMLITLPRQANSYPSLINHLSALKTIFCNLKISFLSHLDNQEFVSALTAHEPILLKKDDLGWTGLPTGGFVRMLKNYGFDMALDLDLSGDFLNAYLGFLSGAKLRIGVKDKWGPPFYNLELVIPSHRLNPDERYDSLVSILKNLTPEKTVEV